MEAKKRALPLNRRALSVNDFGELVVTDLDNRIVKGYLVLWGQRNYYNEKFVKGCFAKSIREHGPGTNAAYEIKFLNQHQQREPLSLFAVLIEDDKGLYFETVPLDDVDYADRVLKQLKSRTLNNFSIGFDYIWEAGKIEWDDKDDSLVIIEAILFEGSVVTIPADFSTYAIRSMEQLEVLDDEIQDFIHALPRRHQLEARSLFSRQKALIDVDQPPQQRAIALGNTEPLNGGLDYKQLTQNLKIF